MPKSTPSPTNSTANAIESRFSEPTIHSPTAVVMERPIKRFRNTAKMIFVECSAIQRINSTTSTVPIPLTMAPSWTVANSSLAIGTGPVSLTRAPYSPARLRSRAACRMASVASLPGSSALKSRIGLNSMNERRSASVKGLSLVSSRKEKVPEPFFITFSTVWAISVNGRSVPSSLTCPRLTPASPVSSAPVIPRMLGSAAMISISGGADSDLDQREWPLGAVEFDLPALDASEPGFQRAGHSPYAGIARHDLDQRGCGFELAGQLAHFGHRQEQQPVLFKERSRAERLDRFDMNDVAGQFLRLCVRRSAG